VRKFAPVDVHVGLRIRQRRALLGISQTELANLVGVAFQQIQKYERGWDRISASRLYELAHVLDVPPTFFFEELPARGSPRAHKHIAEKHLPFAQRENSFAKRETLVLVRAFYKIRNEQVRKYISRMIVALGKSGPTSAKSLKKR
jgi:transcriptional regulator with XRE-family HTH domain